MPNKTAMAIMITIKNDKEDPAMKLAEALQERADLNRRIEQLRNRLENSALVQEGVQPCGKLPRCFWRNWSTAPLGWRN